MYRYFHGQPKTNVSKTERQLSRLATRGQESYIILNYLENKRKSVTLTATQTNVFVSYRKGVILGDDLEIWFSVLQFIDITLEHKITDNPIYQWLSISITFYRKMITLFLWNYLLLFIICMYHFHDHFWNIITFYKRYFHAVLEIL